MFRFYFPGTKILKIFKKKNPLTNGIHTTAHKSDPLKRD